MAYKIAGVFCKGWNVAVTFDSAVECYTRTQKLKSRSWTIVTYARHACITVWSAPTAEDAKESVRKALRKTKGD